MEGPALPRTFLIGERRLVRVYPIVEERLVVEKRLYLKEELRISYNVTTEEVTEVVNLRKVHADVERTPVDVTPTPSSKNI